MNHTPSPMRLPQPVLTHAAGFTLIELLMAMAIGLVISNIAMVSFIATQKYIYRMETLAAKNDAAQSMILWCLTKTGGNEDDYPTGGQFRHIGGKVTLAAEFCTLELYDCRPATPTVITGNTLYVPVTGN
jgi:prepilin-type N-terminal cleavage/methylation domain-containing protein